MTPLDFNIDQLQLLLNTRFTPYQLQEARRIVARYVMHALMDSSTADEANSVVNEDPAISADSTPYYDHDNWI